MDIPKKYFQNKTILFLVAINVFLTVVITVVVLLRFNTSSDGYFTQFRSNLGLNAYKIGSFWSIAAFSVFAVFVTAFHTFMSIKLYSVRKYLAVAVLGCATLLLVLTMVVSNALLVLAR